MKIGQTKPAAKFDPSGPAPVGVVSRSTLPTPAAHDANTYVRGETVDHGGAALVRGRIARFTVLRKLGEGGMGVVYAGYDEALDRKIAIKLIRSRVHDHGARLRLLREGQGLAQLSHPNVVQVYETGEFDSSIYEPGPMPPEEVVR